MTKVYYHCCGCSWEGQRIMGSTKPCPWCKRLPSPDRSYRCRHCHPDIANRYIAPAAEQLPSAWPGGKVPAALRILTRDTGKITTYSIPRQPRKKARR